MPRVEERLRELEIELSSPPRPQGTYEPAVISGKLIFVSGQLPLKGGKLLYRGKLGSEISIEEGIEAARLAAINSLSVMQSELGDLGRIKRIVKLTGYVSSALGFNMQAKALNGASQFFYEVFGDMGRHARSAVGVYELPLEAPIEIEVIAEIS
jgi:enamine deaminase RidA (YjgF/YER057c/UK114 family)